MGLRFLTSLFLQFDVLDKSAECRKILISKLVYEIIELDQKPIVVLCLKSQ